MCPPLCWVALEHRRGPSLFLFTLYTSHFVYNTESCQLLKYSDDSAVVAYIRDGEETAVVDICFDLCELSHLLLNISESR